MKSLTTFLILLFTWAVYAQDIPDLKTPPVTRETLENGVRLLLIEDKGLPLTRIQIIFNQGAVHDPNGLAGVGNLSGEMLLRGTKTLTKEKIRHGFETLGASVSVSVGPKETAINISCLSEALDPTLDLIQKILEEPSPKEAELALAKNEIIEGIKSMPDRTSGLTQTVFREFADPQNPYMRFPNGRISTVKKISLKGVIAFNKNLIRGGNITVAAVSSLGVSELKNKISETVKNLPSGKTEEVKVPELKTWDGMKVLILDKKGQETMNIQVGQPTNLWAGSTQRVPLIVTNYMFGSAPLVSALFREIRSNRGWTYGVSSNYAFQPYRAPYAIFLFPTKKFGMQALKLALEMMGQYFAMGVAPSELRYSKNAIINQSPFLFETAEDVLTRILDEEIRGTPKGYYESYAENVSKVNEETSTAARAEAHSKSGMLAAVILGDAKEIQKELKKIPGVTSVKVIKAEDYLK